MGIGAGLYMCDVVVKKFTFAISSPDEFLYFLLQLLKFAANEVAEIVRYYLLNSPYCILLLRILGEKFILRIARGPKYPTGPLSGYAPVPVTSFQ